MWKIYTTLNSDLKRYDPYKKIIAGRICFFRGRGSYSGERWHVILKDLIEEMFDENICRIYKF